MRLIAVLCFFASFTPLSHAAITITAVESGGDVIISFSGSVDLTGLTVSSTGGGSTGSPTITPSATFLTIVPIGGVSAKDVYTGWTAPSAFGPGGATAATSSTATDSSFIGLSGTFMLIESGYTSGTFISGSSTWTGSTFTSLGLTPGTYTWTSTSDTITFTVVPEPSSAALLGLALLAGGLWRRRRATAS